MKKNMKKLLGLVISSIMVITLNACGSVDFHSEVQGSWTLYHYYESAENGVDVFFDDTNYWMIDVDDTTFTVTAVDDSLEDVGGTYTWTKADEADVVMNDGTHCTMRISENDKKHNESAAFDIYVVETNMYYVLEIPGGEE